MHRATRIAVMLLTIPWMVVVPCAPAAAQAGEATSADPPATGVVRLVSSQPGGRVYIDNVEVGETPISRYVTPGVHTIRITADHSEPFVRRIDVPAGATVEVKATFLPGTGSVEFAPTAPGARVSVDGGEPVPTPVRLHDIPEGKHKYRIEAEGFEPFDGTFTFNRGRNYLLTPTLTRGDGKVVVRTVPEGLDAWLDGTSVGATPLNLESVAPGVHQLRLVSADGITMIREVDNSDGAKVELTIKAPSQAARVTVLTSTKDAQVRLGGVVVGSGKKVRLGGLERGQYDVVVESEGLAAAQRKVDVPADGKVTYTADLEPDGGTSTLEEGRPLTRRWAFWTAIGAGAAGVGAGSMLVASALTPPEVPDPSVIVTLP
jgi:PEGA domain